MRNNNIVNTKREYISKDSLLNLNLNSVPASANLCQPVPTYASQCQLVPASASHTCMGSIALDSHKHLGEKFTGKEELCYYVLC